MALDLNETAAGNGAPRAFVSHASEDKQAFGEPLARALRAKGVDAWLDKWEIRPGDSLVERIFEEGLKNTAAVVVILSAHSVEKPWVQKELNVAVVKSIDKTARVIPVRVDDCKVPESLQDLLWIDWHKKGGAEAVALEIANTVFENHERPPLGPRPKHLESVELEVPGLNKQDALVLQLIFEVAMSGHREFIQTGEVLPMAEKHGLSLEQINESAEILMHQGYLWDKHSNLHQRYFIAELPVHTFLQLAAAFDHDVEGCRRRVASLILNEDIGEGSELSKRSGFNQSLVEAVIDDFEDHGFLKTLKALGGTVRIHSPNAKFKRWLGEQT